MIDSELLIRLARKIKSIRSIKNMTLSDLAKQSHVSKGLLSKIENSHTIPSLPVFLGIIHALDIPLKDFFDGVDLLQGRNYLLVKRTESPQSKATDGFSYLSVMTQNLHENSMQMVILQVAPGARSTPSTTDGHELKYIISGKCDYYLNEEIIHLEEGDSFYFDGSKPHMPVNRGRIPVIMLVIYFLK